MIRRKGKPRFKEGRDPEYLAWIRTLPCLVPQVTTGGPKTQPCQGVTVAAHVKTRGAMGPDRGNAIPMCWGHHDEQTISGISTFERRYAGETGWMKSWAHILEHERSLNE